MNEIELFRFPRTGQNVRCLLVDDTPWFVGRDGAVILGHSNPRKAIRDHVPARHKGGNESFPLAELGLDPQTVLISESGLYRLIMRSNTPLAEEFQDWVCDEVLPALRETGRYAIAEVAQPALPDSLPTALRALADEIEAHNETKGQLAEQRPKADAFDHLMEADGTFEWAATAQIFSRLTGGLGRNNFLELLRELKVLKADNTPYQHNYEPYFRVRANAGGNKTTYVTPRGLEWLRRRLVKHFNPQDALFAIGDIA